MVLNAGNNEIAISNEERLRYCFRQQINFDSHITCLCKRAGQKFGAVARITHSISENFAVKLTSKLLIQLFPTDLDVYFPISNALNIIHERALRLTYNALDIIHERALRLT